MAETQKLRMRIWVPSFEPVKKSPQVLEICDSVSSADSGDAMAGQGDPGGAGAVRGKARVVGPNRGQTSLGVIDLEAELAADHMARLVWDFVVTLDLSPLYDRIKSREGTAGRPAADPRVLLALWLLATIEGVGSARALSRLCEQSFGYRWLTGDTPVNYHGLADFRVAHADVLDDLLTLSLASLIASGLATPDEIIVDGTKVKASASRSSFKRASRLDEAEATARQRVAALKAEVEADPAATSKRQQAARERAERERAEKIAKARATLAKIDKERSKRAEHDKKDVERMKAPRASLSDPEARSMRFADGAVRPGYNVQIAVTSGEGFITAVRATDRRHDKGLVKPMVEASEQQTGAKASRVLADTGYVHADDITALGARAEHPVEAFIRPARERDDVKPATSAERRRKRERENDTMKAWRTRMASEAAEAVMKKRGRIERVNAHLKNHGFGTMVVRGLAKVQAVALLHALAHNLLTALRLTAARAAA
jgi:transposase